MFLLHKLHFDLHWSPLKRKFSLAKEAFTTERRVVGKCEEAISFCFESPDPYTKYFATKTKKKVSLRIFLPKYFHYIFTKKGLFNVFNM